jgi:hypothetical protein
MTDFRHTWRGDFDIAASVADGEAHAFVLRAIKPE